MNERYIAEKSGDSWVIRDTETGYLVSDGITPLMRYEREAIEKEITYLKLLTDNPNLTFDEGAECEHAAAELGEG